MRGSNGNPYHDMTYKGETPPQEGASNNDHLWQLFIAGKRRNESSLHHKQQQKEKR